MTAYARLDGENSAAYFADPLVFAGPSTRSSGRPTAPPAGPPELVRAAEFVPATDFEWVPGTDFVSLISSLADLGRLRACPRIAGRLQRFGDRALRQLHLERVVREGLRVDDCRLRRRGDRRLVELAAGEHPL